MSELNQEFESFYKDHLGERWELLREALLQKREKQKLPNPFGGPEYELDPASVVAAETLQIKKGSQVLDLCAAPGGKSLVLIYQVLGEATFYLNDLSEKRLQRLKRVIRDYTTPEVFDSVKLAKSDGEKWGVKRKGEFDFVLLDAPCSGEQHLLETKKEYEAWTKNRAKRLVQRQYSLLCSALLCLKPGGELLYSTCSVNPNENDGVVQRLLNKKSDQVKSLAIESSTGERTEWGWQVWPDKYPGRGPIYFAKLQKI